MRDGIDPAELGALRAELDARSGCEVVLEACADERERDLAHTIKRRIDEAAGGKTPMVSMTDASKILRDRRKARRQAAG